MAGEVLYVGYRGDECLGVHTVEEWAAIRHIKPSSVQFLASPAGKTRADGARDGMLFERVEVGRHD